MPNVAGPAGPDHQRVEEVAPGAWAALALREGAAISNSGLVDLGGGTLLFDTSLTPASARALKGISQRVLASPPSVVANSHWHLDHLLGNSELEGVPIWSTRRTREIVLERHDRLTAELRHEELVKSVRELEARRGLMVSEDAREDLAWALSIGEHLVHASHELRLVAPDRTFESRLRLPGARAAELVSFGPGHTEADAVLHLPDEHVLFAGDLVVSGVQPSMGSGDPEHWLTVLDEIDRLRPERIVPGHGPVLGPDGTRETREYVGGIVQAASAAGAHALPNALRRWEGSVSLEENLAFARRRAPKG